MAGEADQKPQRSLGKGRLRRGTRTSRDELTSSVRLSWVTTDGLVAWFQEALGTLLLPSLRHLTQCMNTALVRSLRRPGFWRLIDMPIRVNS